MDTNALTTALKLYNEKAPEGDQAYARLWDNGFTEICTLGAGIVAHFAHPEQAVAWLNGEQVAFVAFPVFEVPGAIDDEDVVEIQEASEDDPFGPAWEVDYEVLDNLHK